MARLVAAAPALQARSSQLARDFERAVAEHLRSRGYDTTKAELLAGACMGALAAARRLATPESGAISRLIDEAMTVLAGGWPRIRRRTGDSRGNWEGPPTQSRGPESAPHPAGG